MRLGFAITLSFSLMAVLLGGCSDDAAGKKASYLCQVDEALLAQQTACSRDVDCPCGAHCASGLCVHQCTKDADCSGGTQCDAFGRCRKEVDQAAPIVVPGAGRLSIKRPVLSVYSWSLAGKVGSLPSTAPWTRPGSWPTRRSRCNAPEEATPPPAKYRWRPVRARRC